MRAARYHAYGDPSALVVEDAPEPHALADSVRIKVEAHRLAEGGGGKVVVTLD